VTVSAQCQRQKEVVLWSGRQQDLFRKNSAKRNASIQAITASLQDFKQEFCMDNDDEQEL
jgi:hypothetical protein